MQVAVGRRERLAASCLAVVVLAPLLVAVFRTDGFHEAKVNLNDAGVWVTSRQRAAVGRINTQIKSIEVRFRPPTGMAAFDVVQADDAVVLFDPRTSRMATVQVATATTSTPRKMPKNGQVDVRAGTGMLLDTAKGRVWTSTATAIAGIDYTQSAPAATVGAKAVGAVAADGSARVYSAGSKQLWRIASDGEATKVKVGSGVAKPALTTVGSTTVLLDRTSRRLTIVGGPSVDLRSLGRSLVLQQPGPAAADVVIGSDKGLFRVRLDGGKVNTIAEVKSTGVSAPVWLDGCSYGAWGTKGMAVQACEGKEVQQTELEGLAPKPDLQFRVNRGRVLLNDRAGEVSWLFSEDKPEPIANWDDAESRNKPDERNENTTINQQPPKCATKPGKPQAKPITAGTRPDRPVIINVLESVKGDRCDVVTATVPVQPEGAKVAVVRNGAAIQVTPAPGKKGRITFGYVVTGKTGETDGSNVALDIIPTTEGNRPPVLAKEQRTVVEAGRTVRHDVLIGAIDPDGDSLALIDASLPDGGGQVRFQADGAIFFTADSTTTTGRKTVEYTVEDEQGDSSNAKLFVQVTAEGTNIAPTARNDHISGAIGTPTSVKLLANDTDPNGDDLTVLPSNDMPTSLAATLDAGTGVLTVTPAKGTEWFTYSVVDGNAGKSTATVRVDGLEGNDDAPPVAVRDDAVARPDSPTMIDVLDNDISPSGSVLATVQVTPPLNSRLLVEVLEMRIVRITAAADFRVAEVVRYTVTDGRKTDDGVLVVRPYRQPPNPQPLHTERDRITVKAGNVASSSVLANDSDPLGERLKLTGVTLADPTAGDIFVSGDVVRFVALSSAKGTYKATYDVRSMSGVRATEELIVQVLAPDAKNRQPGPVPTVEARVFEGRAVAIHVPLVGLDPDGDPVAIIGRKDSPSRGRVKALNDGFEYTPDAGVTGSDEFSYQVQDPDGLKASGIVRIVVARRPDRNSPPVAVRDNVVVRVGGSRSVAVLANDSDPDGDEVALVAGTAGVGTPRHGTVKRSNDGLGLVYRADETVPSSVKGDAFEYRISDSKGVESRTTVSVKLVRGDPPVEPPVARDDFAPAARANKTVTVAVLKNDLDPDGDASNLDVDVPHPPKGASVKVSDGGSLQVRVGDRSVAFAYRVTDPDGAQAWALVQIPVFRNALLTAPDFSGPDVKAGESVDIDVMKEVPSVDGKRPELVQILNPSQGTAKLRKTGDQTRVRFSALDTATGDGHFDYQVRLGSQTRIGTVRLRITGRKLAAPRLQVNKLTLRPGETHPIDLRVLSLEPAAGELTFGGLAGGTSIISGRLEGSNLVITVSEKAYDETANLAFTATNETGDAATGLVSVDIDPNSTPAPIAEGDEATTTEGKAVVVAVLENDIYEGDRPKPVVLSSSDGRAVTASDGTVRFTPTGGFSGVARFSYQISDRGGKRPSEAFAEITVLGLPGAPLPPTGTASSRTITLAWDVPAKGAATITRYVVTSDAGKTQRVAGTSATFEGLQNGTSYRFKVAAQNPATELAGLSGAQLAYSGWSIPLRPNQKPDQAAAPTVTSGDRQITVDWTAPNNEGTPILSYEVQNLITGDVQTVSGSQTSLTATGLDNGTAYAFKVRAINEEGEADWSEPSDISSDGATPAGKPFAPQGVSAERNDADLSTGGAVTVTWAAADPNGAPVNEYQVVAVKSGGGAGSPASVDGQTLSAPISGLENGSSYTFRVVAVNKVGTSDPGSSNAVVPSKRPDQVGRPTASEGDGSVVLAFANLTGTATGGDPIVRYEIRGGANTTCSSGSSCSISGLTNGTAYSFTVSACNGRGCGPESEASAGVVPRGNPSAVAFNTPSVGSSTITWTWNVPSGNGRSIIGYDVSLDGGGYSRQTGTSYNGSGFGKGTTHTLRVIAVNEADLKSTTASQGATTPSRPTVSGISRQFVKCHTNPGTTLEGGDIRYYVTIDMKGHPASDFSNVAASVQWSNPNGSSSLQEVYFDDNNNGTGTLSAIFFHANLRVVKYFQLSVNVNGEGTITAAENRNDGDWSAQCPTR